jgi:hypothetical protein
MITGCRAGAAAGRRGNQRGASLQSGRALALRSGAVGNAFESATAKAEISSRRGGSGLSKWGTLGSKRRGPLERGVDAGRIRHGSAGAPAGHLARAPGRRRCRAPVTADFMSGGDGAELGSISKRAPFPPFLDEAGKVREEGRLTRGGI